MDFPVYVPEPLMLFLASGYIPTDERRVEWLLEELGIRVIEG